VTHPDARRFFMSIPEAVQLVLQASSLGEKNANLQCWRMGEPVKIRRPGRNLIELSGLKVGEDIEITFTGMAAGRENRRATAHAQENLAHPSRRVACSATRTRPRGAWRAFGTTSKSHVELECQAALQTTSRARAESRGRT